LYARWTDKVNQIITVEVKVVYPYEHPQAVSGDITIKDDGTPLGTVHYSGTHWYGFSETLYKAVTRNVKDNGTLGNLTWEATNVKPISTWQPTVTLTATSR
jgi:hypothetical protein